MGVFYVQNLKSFGVQCMAYNIGYLDSKGAVVRNSSHSATNWLFLTNVPMSGYFTLPIARSLSDSKLLMLMRSSWSHSRYEGSFNISFEHELPCRIYNNHESRTIIVAKLRPFIPYC